MNNSFFTTVKERARATRENDGEQSAKPKPSEALTVGVWRGDLKAREGNTVRKPQQAQRTEAWTTQVPLVQTERSDPRQLVLAA